MSIDDLRFLTPDFAHHSYLTDDEWNVVFQHINRGVAIAKIWESFASKKGYKTLAGFYRSVQNRRKYRPEYDRIRKVRADKKKEPGS